VPGDAARQAMIGDGLPGFVAGQLVAMFDRLRQGAGAQVTDAVETLTGSAPRDFAAFAADHARLFTPVTIGGAR